MKFSRTAPNILENARPAVIGLPSQNPSPLVLELVEKVDAFARKDSSELVTPMTNVFLSRFVRKKLPSNVLKTKPGLNAELPVNLHVKPCTIQ